MHQTIVVYVAPLVTIKRHLDPPYFYARKEVLARGQDEGDRDVRRGNDRNTAMEAIFLDRYF